MKIRPASEVMKPSRLGAAFQTRISFMRRLIRHMHQENWVIKQKEFNLDKNGFGDALYSVHTPNRNYSLVCFSHYLDSEHRTDRVIAESWDTTFTLFDGIPDPRDIARLKEQTPKQESGRFSKTDLVLSRANKSLRLFDYVIDNLARGQQPDSRIVNDVGYLMRTTAVYANGKFGLADRSVYSDRYELREPYQAEMLTVYLIREFCHDLVDHIAHCRSEKLSVKLHKKLKRHIGMGNATGLGMAPFLVDHPFLIHKWFFAKESALGEVRSIERAKTDKIKTFQKLVEKAKVHITEWNVEDKNQKTNIKKIHKDISLLIKYIDNTNKISKAKKPWNELFNYGAKNFSTEGQELLVSLLLELYPEIINSFSLGLDIQTENLTVENITVSELKAIIEKSYQWVFAHDFNNRDENKHFWYYSQDKNEPRRGIRDIEPGVECEMPIAIAKDVVDLYKILKCENKNLTTVQFMVKYPNMRHVVKRLQQSENKEYAEIRGNIISANCEPVDILRGKLAFFGATKFDPKSSLWTRITLCQGAPLRDEISTDDADDWCFPVQPVISR